MEPKGVAMGFAHLVGILFFLYFFLVALNLMGSSFVLLAGDSAGNLFSFVDNPLAGLMVGILATVLVQSSSTTTSIVVSMAGAGVITVNQGIFLIMGANIGTSVTNTIVSLGFVGDREQMKRGFAGATVHDCFNLLAVCFWLPIEWIVQEISGTFGPLGEIARLTAESFEDCGEGDECEKWEGPLKTVTKEIASRVISPNKDVIKDFAQGAPNVEWCADNGCTTTDPVSCKAYKFNDKRCFKGDIIPGDESLISGYCETGEKKDKASFDFCLSATSTNATIMAQAQDHYDAFKLNKAGFMYDADWSRNTAGAVTLVFSLVMLMVCLFCMVKLLGRVLQGQTQEVARKILNLPGPLAIILGALLTMFVQSSSITTSVLTPLVALGTIELESMLPLTLGANIGTTITGVLSSLVGNSPLGFQVAMVHVYFNVFSTCLLYPIPFIRAIPLKAARTLGFFAATYKAFPFVYIICIFFLTPAILLGVSVGLGSGEAGGIVGGVFGLLAYLGIAGGLYFWYNKKDGKEWLESRFAFTDEDYAEMAEKNGAAVVAPGTV